MSSREVRLLLVDAARCVEDAAAAVSALAEQAGVTLSSLPVWASVLPGALDSADSPSDPTSCDRNNHHE